MVIFRNRCACLSADRFACPCPCLRRTRDRHARADRSGENFNPQNTWVYSKQLKSSLFLTLQKIFHFQAAPYPHIDRIYE